MFDAGGSAHFLCSLLLRWSLQNLILILRSPYLAVVPKSLETMLIQVCVLCRYIDGAGYLSHRHLLTDHAAAGRC